MNSGRNDLCHCGSGRKYKDCCLFIENKKILKFKEMNSQKENERIGTIAYYGPNNKIISKIVVSILSNGNEIINIKKWYSDSFDMKNNQSIKQEIADFLKLNSVSSTAMVDRVIGCPHEEGIDYPENESCPLCPFWANRNRWNG